MLVLSRKNGESIWIGGAVKVEVLEVKGGKVKLGISAPLDINIQRDEIRDLYPGRLEDWHDANEMHTVCA